MDPIEGVILTWCYLLPCMYKVLNKLISGRWSCECCDYCGCCYVHCCNRAWQGKSQLPYDDYQREQEERAVQDGLQNKGQDVESHGTYPNAPAMVVGSQMSASTL